MNFPTLIITTLLFSEKWAVVQAFRILYPKDYFELKKAEEPYHLEYEKIQAKDGIDCSLLDQEHAFEPSPQIQSGETVLYRGWMMTPTEYQHFCDHLENKGAKPITSFEDYVRCHHLPGWYDRCKDLTSETYFVKSAEIDDDLQSTINKLGWKKFFVKDYVKSNTGPKGSIAISYNDCLEIVGELKKFRGEIEGGISLRKFEEYIPGSEQRYFVVHQTAYSPSTSNDDIPEIVQAVADRIAAPFFAVDVAKTVEGEWRVIEVGDGQVSDKKEWPLERFIDQVLCSIPTD